MDKSISKYLSVEEIDSQYRTYLKQLACKMLETNVNISICPGDTEDLQKLCTIYKGQLYLLEVEYEQWKKENGLCVDVPKLVVE